jgi:peptidoglycan/LPS O-acetylase OafA/YrhL
VIVGKSYKLEYMPQLDTLRAISVLAVLYTHYLPKKYWLLGVEWGVFGPRCFFVISGFLITSMLLKTMDGSTSLQSTIVPFLVRRAARLMPLLIAVLVFAVILEIPRVQATFWWHITYLSNVYFTLINKWDGPVSHLWTLAVEEQFYLLWPFVLFFVPRRFLAGTTILLVGLSLVFRWLWMNAGLGFIGAWVLPPASFDALGMGALLAIWRGSTLFQRALPAAAAAGFFLIVGIYAGVFQNNFIADTELYQLGNALLFGWIVAKASQPGKGPLDAVLNNGILRYLGRISYGIYLLHLFVVYYVWGRLGSDANVLEVSALSTLVTIALASLSWHFFEQPIRQLARRILDRREISDETRKPLLA